MDETSSGGGYTLPDVDNVYDADGASEALNRIHAEALSDNSHPYVNANHPQHRDYQSRVNDLYRIKLSDTDPRPPLTVLKESILVENAAAQEQRVSEGERYVDDMVAIGFDRAEVPEDVTGDELALMKIHAQCVNGQWPEAIAAIREAVIDCNASADARALVRDIESEADNAERLHTAQGLLKYVWTKQRERFGLGPR